MYNPASVWDAWLSNSGIYDISCSGVLVVTPKLHALLVNVAVILCASVLVLAAAVCA